MSFSHSFEFSSFFLYCYSISCPRSPELLKFLRQSRGFNFPPSRRYPHFYGLVLPVQHPTLYSRVTLLYSFVNRAFLDISFLFLTLFHYLAMSPLSERKYLHILSSIFSQDTALLIFERVSFGR